MNKTKFTLLAAGVVLAMVFTFSCDSGSSAFVGKWVLDDGSESMELFKDGTGVVQKGNEGVAISWKVMDKRFVITATIRGSLVSYAEDYEISGNKLTFTDDKGKKEIYVKLQEGKIEGETLKDKRDGKKYKTVIIGAQTWMAENLNYDAGGSKCFGEGGKVITEFDDKGNPTATKTLSDKEVLNNCAKYGRLYDWTTAKEACPSGWHLPSTAEWEKLIDFIGGEKIAGKKLKSNSGWNENGNGTDEFEFSALPGGRGSSDGSFDDVGNHGRWWSSTEVNALYAYRRTMYNGHSKVYRDYYDKSKLFSVRCLQD